MSTIGQRRPVVAENAPWRDNSYPQSILEWNDPANIFAGQRKFYFPDLPLSSDHSS